MVGRGKLTTITSDIALVAGTIYAAPALTPDIIIQIFLIAAALGIAIADVLNPEFMDKLETALEKQDAEP